MEVTDDGRGFVPRAEIGSDETGKHFGLLAMRERVAMLGGTLDVESRPGSGTRVRASIPIEGQEERG
ncbi:MAG: hypothetical protein HY240_09760 [Actinobacteria bacterium]|nr:hypothetical protein [Actinomycetota bacterium]